MRSYSKPCRLRVWVLNFMALAMINVGFVQSAGAGVIGTEQAMETRLRANRVAELEEFIARDEVRSQLLAYGVTPEAATARIRNLTDREIAELGDRIDHGIAGGDALAVVGTVFLVLLILELVGVTDIFKSI